MTVYLTNNNDLTSVANAIRTKSGTSSSLTYPTGFITAINNISSGGSGNIEDVSSLFSFRLGDPVEGHMEIYAAWLDRAVSICGRVIDLDLDLGSEEGLVTADSRFMPDGDIYDLSSTNMLVCEITPVEGVYMGSNLEDIYDDGDEILFRCTTLISEGDGFFTAYYVTEN